MTALATRKTKLSVELPIEERSISRSKKHGTRRVMRPIVADFHMWGVEMRLKGTKQKYSITYNQIFNRAVLIEAEAKRAAKKAARKARAA